MIVLNPDRALRRLQAGRPLFPTGPEGMTRLRRLSCRDAASWQPQLRQIEAWCTFIGYPASGHTLIGSLLDAHPEIAIAHEMNALAFVAADFDFSQIVSLVMCNAATFAKIGRSWGGFDYAVPGQWQGRCSRLRVIGDKKAGMSSYLLAQNPSLVRKLAAVVPVRRRFIHVMRNPFDNIATLALKQGVSPGSEVPAAQIERYLRLHANNRRLIKAVGTDAVCNSYHEAMTADPAAELARLCRFLGVAASADYLAACGSIVFRAPSLSRQKLVWPPDAIAALERRLARAPLLAHYRYEAA